MNSPRIRIRLDGNGRVYRPGETLSGEYSLDGILAEDVRAIEISVLWYTEGKGDEDLAVHDFRRISIENGGVDVGRPGRFSTVLPGSPLTYCGVIVRIHWCVRVRVFSRTGGISWEISSSAWATCPQSGPKSPVPRTRRCFR